LLFSFAFFVTGASSSLSESARARLLTAFLAFEAGFALEGFVLLARVLVVAAESAVAFFLGGIFFIDDESWEKGNG
jgi:hypothetical protein